MMSLRAPQRAAPGPAAVPRRRARSGGLPARAEAAAGSAVAVSPPPVAVEVAGAPAMAEAPAAAPSLADLSFTPAELLDTGAGGPGAAPPPDGPGDGRWGDGGSGGGDPSPPSNPLSFLLRGVRGRLAADPFFGQKLLVELGLDAAIIVGVNWAAKRDRFLPEIEFTACQLAVSLLSDFALVYLLAPSTLRSAAAAGSLRGKLAALPSHVFQRSPPGRAPFALRTRAAALGVKSVQYGGVGFATGCLGAASVQGLIWLRERLDPGFIPPPTVQGVAGTGAAWGTFMSTSSLLRYNVVNGLEDALYRRGPGAGLAGSMALRLANNWAGAAQWMLLTTRCIDLDVPWTPARPAAGGKQRKGRTRAGCKA